MIPRPTRPSGCFPRRRLGRCLVAVVLLALLVTPASRAATPAERAGSDAYVYGFPLLLERATLARLPVNSLIGLGQLATPRAQLVVLPNNDTAYALAGLDLTEEPLVLHMPDTGGRYDVFQILDAYTNVFANPGGG